MTEELKPSYNFSDDRLNELKSLFPEAFEDGLFNVDTLKELIGEFSSEMNSKENFGLNWVGKMDARRKTAKPPTGTIKPVTSHGVNIDNTENIFIEGENLEVLKILRKSYAGKVKMIYIDPPYNTGNDFIYKDDYADSTEDYLKKSGELSEEGLLVSNPKTSGKFHSNWLSFMYPRLRIAKDYLMNGGVIFVSIGVEELANLKSLMDEIFGEENFIEIFSWVKTSTPPALSTKSRKTNEYILCYENIKSNYKYDGELLDGGDQPLLNRGNAVRTLLFPKDKVRFTFDGKCEIGTGDRTKLKTQITITNGVADKDFLLEGEFKWEEKNFEKEIEQGTTFIVKSNNFSIRFIREGEGYKRPTNFIKEKILQPLINKKDNNVGTNEQASNEVEDIFGKKVFDYPKPVSLLKYLISFIVKDNDIVLDFFAGSGSTGHAIFDLVKEKMIRPKFILIQINDKLKDDNEPGKNAIDLGYKTVSEITRARLKFSIEKYYPDQGFLFFKHSASSFFKWQDFDPNTNGNIIDFKKQLELSLTKSFNQEADDQELITEILLQKGFSLNSTIDTISDSLYKITDANIKFDLFISLEEKLKDENLRDLKIKEIDHFVCIDDSFENDTQKQNLDNRCKLFTI